MLRRAPKLPYKLRLLFVISRVFEVVLSCVENYRQNRVYTNLSGWESQ